MYALPYILLIVVLGLMAAYYQATENENTKRQLTFWSYALVLWFFGCRGFISDDWQLYYPAFQSCTADDITFAVFGASKGMSWSFEPGFTLLMFICKSIVNEYFFFQFVCSAINLFLLYRFLRPRIDNMPFGLVLFISFGGFGLMTNLIRNSISILIFANALTYIEQRKPLQYFGLILLAFTIHTSSVIYIPFYFFIHRKINKWVYLGLFVGFNVLFLAHFSILEQLLSAVFGDSAGRLAEKAQSYTEEDALTGARGISIGYLERLFTGILLFCYFNTLIKIREENRVFINLFLTYAMMTFVFADFKVISDRFGLLFILAYWILWYDLPSAFSVDNNRKLFMGFICIYCILKMIGTTNIPSTEYDNVLFNAKSYEQRLYIHDKIPDK